MKEDDGLKMSILSFSLDGGRIAFFYFFFFKHTIPNLLIWNLTTDNLK